MSVEIVDLCGGHWSCDAVATHVVHLERVDRRVRPLKLCSTHVDDLRRRSREEGVEVESLIEGLES